MIKLKVEDLYLNIKEGKRPIIKFNEGVYQWLVDSADPLMTARILNAEITDKELIKFSIDFKEFESYNRSVATFDWRDKEGKYTLTWFDSGYYPKDGKDDLYLPKNLKVDEVFEFIKDTTLFNEYLLTNKKTSYLEWLEDELLALRKNES